MLPRLVAFLGDTTSTLPRPMDMVGPTEVGPPMLTRMYPVRTAAGAGIRSLGIKCEEGLKVVEGREEGSVQEVTLDEKSLTDQVEAWITGADRARSREAIAAAGRIKLPAVRAMLERLAQDARLPEEVRGEIKQALAGDK